MLELFSANLAFRQIFPPHTGGALDEAQARRFADSIYSQEGKEGFRDWAVNMVSAVDGWPGPEQGGRRAVEKMIQDFMRFLDLLLPMLESEQYALRRLEWERAWGAFRELRIRRWISFVTICGPSTRSDF